MRPRERAARLRGLLVVGVGMVLLLAGLSWWQAHARRAHRLPVFEELLREVLAPPVRTAGALRNALQDDPVYPMNPMTPVGLARLRQLEGENRRLRRTLALRDRLPQQAIIAEIVGRSLVPGQTYLLLDKGRLAGIRPDMVVLTPSGVLGKVTARVSAHTAEVLPLTDRACGIGAMSTRSGEMGVLKGDGLGRCQLVYLSGQADIRVGDTLVTSGLGRIFPKGLPLGYVLAVTADPVLSARIAKVKPAANPSMAELVLVVK
jgi:rod shape-determining protein MreC